MAARFDLYIDQGATFVARIECADEAGNVVTLEGYSVAAQIRKVRSDTSPVGTFLPLVTPALGVVELSLSADQTAALPTGRAYWDCELAAPGGTVQRLVEGVVRISPEVTRT